MCRCRIYRIKKTEQSGQAESKDKLQISKTRDVFEKVVGSPVGLITGVAEGVGGFIAGGAIAVAGKESGTLSLVGFGEFISFTAMGATAGAMTPYPVVGGIVGGVLGALLPITTMASGTVNLVSEKVKENVEKALSDNKPSDSKIKDSFANFTEGGVAGAITGTSIGFKEGTNVGAGLVSGVIEGVKGAVSTAIGSYEKPVAEKPVEDEKTGLGKKVLNAVIGAPKVFASNVAGLAGGVIGMGMEGLDGAIQGVVIGNDDIGRADVELQILVKFLGSAVVGTAAGFMLGGPVGAVVGLLGGAFLSRVIGNAEAKSGIDKQMAEGITNAIQYAKKDNVYQNERDINNIVRDKTAYESTRDTVESVMTGTAAGMREGFKVGFEAGKGVVDGFVEGSKGVVSGIISGFSGK